jgi:predicted enzyme related to lactoylglutathione lyase
MAPCSVFLNVTDITRSLAFYEGLGFAVEQRHERRRDGVLAYVDLAMDGAEVGLGNIAVNDDPAFRAWVGTPLGAGVVIYVDVADAAAVQRRAERIGATIEQPLEERSYGKVVMLNDPDGYTLAFLEEPASAKAEAPARAAAGKRRQPRPRAAATNPRAASRAKPRAKAKATGKARTPRRQ